VVLALLESRDRRLTYFQEDRDFGLAHPTSAPERAKVFTKRVNIDFEELAWVKAWGNGIVIRPKHFPGSS